MRTDLGLEAMVELSKSQGIQSALHGAGCWHVHKVGQ